MPGSSVAVVPSFQAAAIAWCIVGKAAYCCLPCFMVLWSSMSYLIGTAVGPSVPQHTRRCIRYVLPLLLPGWRRCTLHSASKQIEPASRLCWLLCALRLPMAPPQAAAAVAHLHSRIAVVLESKFILCSSPYVKAPLT